MHRRLYGFIRAHSRATAFTVLAVLGAEAAFIGWQKVQYRSLVEALATPGVISGNILITSSGGEEGIFSRLDRLHVTFASSLYSSDPSAPPLTLDFNIAASFGPFGLTGDIFPLNATADSAKLLNRLQGTHPRLTIRWRHALLDRAVLVAAETTSFDMRLSHVKPGVGPVSVRLASADPIVCKVGLVYNKNIHTQCTAPSLEVSVADPAANITELSAKGTKADILAALNPSAGEGEDVWYAERALLRTERASLSAGDWRGMIRFVLSDAQAESRQDPTAADDYLDGQLDAHAKRLDIALISHQKPFEQKIAGRDFRLRIHARDVPVKLFDSLEDETIEETIESSGPMHFELLDFGFSSGEKGEEKTSAFGALDVRVTKKGVPPETELSLSAELPDSVLQLLETLVSGARMSDRIRSVRSFMTPKDVPGGGRSWELRMKETRRNGLTSRSFTVNQP